MLDGPKYKGPGHETSPPPTLSAIRALACIAFESDPNTNSFHHRTFLQRSHFGGVCRLCPTPTTGEHHG